MSEGERPNYREGYNPLNDRSDENIGVSDQYELLTKFAMEQNLGHYGYGDKLQHLNKNILFTNLKREFKEPETIQRLNRGITILSGHTEQQTVLVPTDEYETIEENDKTITARRIHEEIKIEERRFRRLETYMASKIYAITGTAAGTNAVLLEKLKSTFLNKELSIEDRTATQGGLWAKIKGKK